MLSCQSRRPNRCNAKDMWHKPRCSTDLSRLSLIPPLVTLVIFSFPFHFLSFPWSSISWLLPPSPLYIVSFHLLHAVTQVTFGYIPDSPFRPSLSLFPASWFPLCFHVSVSGALLDILWFALCCYLFEVKTGLHAYLRSSVASFWGLEGGFSTLQTCKTSPKPLVFPKVKHKKGCHFSLSCFISDLWCLMAFWRSRETTVPFLPVCVLVCLLSPWSHFSIFSKSKDDHISFIVSVLHRK